MEQILNYFCSYISFMNSNLAVSLQPWIRHLMSPLGTYFLYYVMYKLSSTITYHQIRNQSYWRHVRKWGIQTSYNKLAAPDQGMKSYFTTSSLIVSLLIFTYHYALPKLHKSPYSFRFTAAARRSTLRPHLCVCTGFYYTLKIIFVIN